VLRAVFYSRVESQVSVMKVVVIYAVYDDDCTKLFQFQLRGHALDILNRSGISSLSNAAIIELHATL